MEQQKLPNATISIVLGSVSFLCCCFSMGIGGIILSAIAFFLARKDESLYQEQPELYSNFGQVKTAKIIAIIGLIIGVITFAWSLYYINSLGGWDAYMEQSKDAWKQMGIDME